MYELFWLFSNSDSDNENNFGNYKNEFRIYTMTVCHVSYQSSNLNGLTENIQPHNLMVCLMQSCSNSSSLVVWH